MSLWYLGFHRDIIALDFLGTYLPTRADMGGVLLLTVSRLPGKWSHNLRDIQART